MFSVIVPNFLIIGAQKAGSSWLANMLSQHPDIFMYPEEIHFFDKDYNWKKGVDWYTSHFVKVKGEKAIGEKTPDYLWANGQGTEGHLPEVHLNIYSILGNAKLIAILRNPVDRAISAANHIIRSGRISPLHNLDDLLIGNKRNLLEPHGVIDYGFYGKQLEAFYEYFNPEKILILIYEEVLLQHPEKGLEKVCKYLEVDHTFEFTGTARTINVGHGSLCSLALKYYLPFGRDYIRIIDKFFKPMKRRPSRKTIKKLYELYENENKRLFEMLGREIESWKFKTA